MTTDVLLKFAKKGINLSPEAYKKVMEASNPVDFSSSLIVKLKSNEYKLDDLVCVSGDIIDKINGKKQDINTTKPTQPQTNTKPTNSIDNFKRDSDKKPKNLDTNSEKVTDRKVKFKRNLEKTNAKYDFKIIQDTSKKSYTSGEIEDIISYFQSRYEKLSKILSKRPELKVHTKVCDVEQGQSSIPLIVMVRDIRSTKNGHKIIEFEDETGTISILFSNKDEDLFNESEKLVKDEVVGIIADKSRDLAIAKEIIKPGVGRIAKKEMDFGIVFLSDVHIGSVTFLEDAFKRFIDWINCEYGSDEQIEVAKDVKYLIIGGDIVDGIGVYPNQDKELEIKDITQQYNKAAEYLGNIRSDIKIIIAPGNHDASRVAEPQPAVPKEYAKALYELDNVEFISNPGVVSLDGINVLIYHGRSFDDLVMAVKDFSHQRNDILMEELLNKRHLAPIYGERTPLASELEDYLVIDEVPDIFHTGHVHINTYKQYNGIHLINSGTFQTQTEFQKIYNIEPTPAEVPIIHKGKYKLFKFVE